MLAESFVEIWKFVARPNFSVPPPERQAANSVGKQRKRGEKEKRTEKDEERNS